MADDAGLGAVATAHQRAGRRFEAGGLTSFVREEGEGEPVVLVHGLPSSSFLYRKMLPELASRGLRAVAFDLPGLGLADRPTDFDYTFAGLGRFAAAAVDALGLERFHLVVHDAGGPVGFEMAAGMPERIRSLTILNTVVTMDKVPFVMEVYARGATGKDWPAMPPPARRANDLPHRRGGRQEGAHRRRDRRLPRAGAARGRGSGLPADHGQPAPRPR